MKSIYRLSKMNLKNLLPIITFPLLVNCATTATLTKEKYYTSTDMIAAGDITNAIKEFPDKEKGYFITTMEKTYLNLLSGNPDIKELSKFARDDSNRIRYKLSREAKSLVYLATPEGYYPSEHEIIWMHMLLSWGYSLKGEYDKAYIEAKESSNLLRMEWSEEGRFDDPLIRIILGALWAMCGNWDEAQVDFRRAAELDQTLKWAGNLGNLAERPKNLIVLLGGLGPEPFLKSESSNEIQFQQRGRKSNLYIKDNSSHRININITPDSSNWYNRHLQRNHKLSEVIKNTQYATIAGSNAAKTTLKTTGGLVTGVLFIAGGIVTGGAIIYAVLSGKLSTSIEAMVGGVVAGVSICGLGIIKGVDVMKESANEASNVNFFPDISMYYRYVRFLPEYAWIGWSNEDISYPVKAYQGKELKFEIDSSTRMLFKENNVLLSYYPDSGTDLIPVKKYEEIILAAISDNDITTIKQIVGTEINTNTKTSDNKSLLQHAVINNRMDICKYFLSLDTNINCQDSTGNSPLLDAIDNKYYDIALLLIKKGANVNLRNYSFMSPLALAVSKENSYIIVKELLSRGASTDSTDEKGWKVIHYAALQNDTKNIKLLRAKGVYLNSKTPDGQTPLQIARSNNNNDVVKLLEEYGSNE
jgi:hypothetical protein